jgi:hypothetical protein
LVPELDGPIYKGIFSDICLLLYEESLKINAHNYQWLLAAMD